MPTTEATQEPKSLLEQAMEAEMALANGAGKAGGADEPAAAAAGEDAPPATDPEGGAAEPGGEPGAAAGEQVDDEGNPIEVNAEGKVVIRKARLKSFIETKRLYNSLVEDLAERGLLQAGNGQPANGAAPTPPAKGPSDPASEAADRLQKAQKALEEADAAFDEASENFDAEAKKAARSKQRQAIQDIADAQGDIKVAKVTAKSAAEGRVNQLRQSARAAEETHKAVRTQMWDEDIKRLETLDDERFDLTDETSPLYVAVQNRMFEWVDAGLPIALRPDAFRKAIESVMSENGIDLPALAAAPAGAPPATPSPAKSNTVIHRRNAGVVAGTSPGASPKPTQEQLIAALNRLPPNKRQEALAQIMEHQTKGAK